MARRVPGYPLRSGHRYARRLVPIPQSPSGGPSGHEEDQLDSHRAPRRAGRWWATAAAATIAVLLLGEAAAAVVGSRLAEPQVWADRAQEVKVAQMDSLAQAGCVDVVVTGNSMVRDAVVPAELVAALGPVTAYNAALDAATPALVEPWMVEVVQERLEPGLVVVGLSSFDLNVNSKAGNAALDAFLSSPGGREGFLAEWDREISQRSALVRHRSQLRDPGGLAKAVTEPAPTPEPLPKEDGRAVIPGVLGPDGEGRSRRDLRYTGPGSAGARFASSQLLADFAMADDPAAEVAELVEAIRSGSGRPSVAVLLLPTTDAFAELHPGGRDQQAAAEAAVVEGARRAGAPLLDLRTLELPDDAFADTHHLNGTGAAELSRSLARRLPEVAGHTPDCSQGR